MDTCRAGLDGHSPALEWGVAETLPELPYSLTGFYGACKLILLRHVMERLRWGLSWSFPSLGRLNHTKSLRGGSEGFPSPFRLILLGCCFMVPDKFCALCLQYSLSATRFPALTSRFGAWESWQVNRKLSWRAECSLLYSYVAAFPTMESSWSRFWNMYLCPLVNRKLSKRKERRKKKKPLSICNCVPESCISQENQDQRIWNNRCSKG